MLLHERHNESSDAARQGPPSAGPAHLDQLRQAGESHLQAAEEAIDRALAGDSLAFLHATRQDGGQ
ncbi:MAG: hypothetical protein ACLQLG_20260 [Thermoguttaceae bacterium]